MSGLKNTDSFSLRKRLKSFHFAFNGIKHLIKSEHNARIHLLALICVLALGVFFRIELAEWIAIIIVAGLVFLTELLNTAIERLADFVEPKWNDKIGLIKDYCAGAVLISALISMLVGGLIFIPKIIEWWG
ncbi:diacylglycerol kinase family protein [Carboxylicivirga sp. M1479]|uniref:diacylglycerol kinase family protein n=1 Tax=Carboxylicivirga sp. M1479 TaxID=2594476 RepID=UPI001C8F268F|nr:diacylglycerol kinase family protein [Carboxylicivirga sp. M1479]